MIYFTSDTHYFHRNIIEYSKRPFASIEVMHEELVKRWNSVVEVTDTVYHLGDISFGREQATRELLHRLKGKIKFLHGNHDKGALILRPGDEDLGSYHELSFQNQKVILCHYPFYTWNRGHRGSWMLHGHCHGNIDKRNESTRRLDVGVDGVASYYPLSFDDVRIIMNDRDYEVVDHHIEED